MHREMKQGTGDSGQTSHATKQRKKPGMAKRKVRGAWGAVKQNKTNQRAISRQWG